MNKRNGNRYQLHSKTEPIEYEFKQPSNWIGYAITLILAVAASGIIYKIITLA